jgi:hypothetical protein
VMRDGGATIHAAWMPRFVRPGPLPTDVRTS